MDDVAYSGRLAFDPDSDFHLAEDGRRVVTEDGGKTWRYAVEGDFSHFERYHRRYVVVNGTTESDPHHSSVQPDDPHFDGVRFNPDIEAPTATSHTEAYRD